MTTFVSFIAWLNIDTCILRRVDTKRTGTHTVNLEIIAETHYCKPLTFDKYRYMYVRFKNCDNESTLVIVNVL